MHPPNNPCDAPSQNLPEPPDPPNQPTELHEGLPDNGDPSDPDDQALEDQIAAALAEVQEKRKKLAMIQKRKRDKPASIQTSGLAESPAEDSDKSSNRPKKLAKLDPHPATRLLTTRVADSSVDNSPSITLSLQTANHATSTAPPPLPSSVNPSKRRARVSLEDPASSSDRARGLVHAAGKRLSGASNPSNGVITSDAQAALWRSPMQILAKGLGMIVQDDGRPTKPGVSVQPHAKSLITTNERQIHNDDDEEQEVQSELTPVEGIQSRKRVLSCSETESTSFGDTLVARPLAQNLGIPPTPSAPSLSSTSSPHPPTILVTIPTKSSPSLPQQVPPPTLPSFSLSLSSQSTFHNNAPTTSKPSAQSNHPITSTEAEFLLKEPTRIASMKASAASKKASADRTERPLAPIAFTPHNKKAKHQSTDSTQEPPSSSRIGNSVGTVANTRKNRPAIGDTSDTDESSSFSQSEHISPKGPLASDKQKRVPRKDINAILNPEESDDSDVYGEPKQVRGRFATRFYPDRSEELKVPGGVLSDRRSAIRYAGKTPEEIQQLCDADKESQQALPKYARGQIKGIKRAYFDGEVHTWLSSRIFNLSLHEDHSAAKGTFQATVIRELFERFPDLHPDNLYLRNAEMEDAYIAKIKSSLTSHTSNLKRKKAVRINHTSPRFGPVLFKSLKRAVKPRPADLWFEDPDVKESLGDWWAEEDEKVAKKYNHDDVRRTRLSRYVDWRKRVFRRLPSDIRAHYTQLAQEMKDNPETIDPETLILHGIPFIQSWLHEFGVITGIPFMFIMSTRNPETPSQIDTYCQTGRGNAPSDIPDFKNIDSDWALKYFIPKWRSFAEKAFVGHDAGAADLTFELIDSAMVDAPPEQPVWAGPEQVQGFDDSDDIPSITRMKDVISTRIKESWVRGYGGSRVDYKKAGQPDYLDPDRRPREKQTVEMEVVEDDGSTVLKKFTRIIVVPLINPSEMGYQDLRAWFKHLTNPGVPPGNRLAFKGELAKLTAKIPAVPATIQKALLLSDDSLGDLDETSSSDDDEISSNVRKPTTRTGKKSKAKASSRTARAKVTEEPEAVESDPHSSANEDPPPYVESDDGPTTSNGDHDSDGVPQNRRSKPTTTQSKRASQPPNREHQPVPKEDQKRVAKKRTPTSTSSVRKKPTTEKQRLPPVSTPLIFYGSTAGESSPRDAMEVPSLVRRLEGIKTLPEPRALANCPSDCQSLQTLFSSLLHIDHIWPNLPALHVPLLPHGFSKQVGSSQYQHSMAVLFDWLNDIDTPAAQILELFKNCDEDTELVKHSFDAMVSFVDCALDQLSSAQMPMRTSSVFGIIARYLDFLHRTEDEFQSVRPDRKTLKQWLDRLAVAGWRSLVLTYCMSTARGFLALRCSTAPLTPPPTLNLENLAQVLTNWWYLSLRKIAHDPSFNLDMADFLPQQWNPSLADSPPCIQLSTFNRRWYRASYTPRLGEQVEHYLEVTLKQNLSAFEGISILDQMQVLASIFAVHEHKHKNEQGLEESWLPYLDRLVNLIRIFCADESENENELHDIAQNLDHESVAPPEKPTQRPAPRRKGKGSDSVHTWALGDIAEITHHKKKLTIQVVEQDDQLVMVNHKTRVILKTRQGTPYVLPDAKDARILRIGTKLDRTDQDLRRLPSILPPKPIWHKPETYAYDVFLSDDDRAEAALAAEANKPLPSIVDPELDPQPSATVTTATTTAIAAPSPGSPTLHAMEHKKPQDVDMVIMPEQGNEQGDIVLKDLPQNEEGPPITETTGNLEQPTGVEAADSDDKVYSDHVPKQGRAKPKRSNDKKVYIKEPSSTQASRSQDAQENPAPGNPPGVGTTQIPSRKKSILRSSKTKAAMEAKTGKVQSSNHATGSNPAKAPETRQKAQTNRLASTPGTTTSRVTRASTSKK